MSQVSLGASRTHRRLTAGRRPPDVHCMASAPASAQGLAWGCSPVNLNFFAVSSVTGRPMVILPTIEVGCFQTPRRDQQSRATAESLLAHAGHRKGPPEAIAASTQLIHVPAWRRAATLTFQTMSASVREQGQQPTRQSLLTATTRSKVPSEHRMAGSSIFGAFPATNQR